MRYNNATYSDLAQSSNSYTKQTDEPATSIDTLYTSLQGGGEGFAFWYVSKRMLGPVFGSADYWDGLGIFFDTYNNDGKGQSPLVLAIYNDGTQSYSAYDDGVKQAAGMCSAPYLRNRKANSWARIRNVGNRLTVELAFDATGSSPNYQPCIEVGLNLGLDKFFGVTAHTGQPIVTNPPSPQIADNHDIYSITTYDLTQTGEDLSRRRSSYRQEVVEKHSQMPNHHDVTPTEFKREVISILGQVQFHFDIG